MTAPPEDITQLLGRLSAGDEKAGEELFPVIYDQLHGLAKRYMRRERSDHTLQPTALVHEAFIKLTGSRSTSWESRAHFFAVAAKAMRQILANHAESKKAAKRGGGQHRVTLSGLATPPGVDAEIDLKNLEAALVKLSELSPRQARIVEMRFLANLNEEEIAHVIGVSTRTIQREWRMAQAFLECELSGDHLS